MATVEPGKQTIQLPVQQTIQGAPQPAARAASQTMGSIAKRRLLSQEERAVLVCDQIEELSNIFCNQVETCNQVDVPVAMVLMELTNIRELKHARSVDVIVNEIARHLLSVVRSHDLVVQYGTKFVAILLVDADQIIGARVCQRVKESVHKYSFLHHTGGSLELVFGVSDNSESKYAEIEALIFAAAKALNLAQRLGDGAIIRSADLDPAQELPPREHFLPGDRLSSMAD